MPRKYLCCSGFTCRKCCKNSSRESKAQYGAFIDSINPVKGKLKGNYVFLNMKKPINVEFTDFS